MNDDRETLAQRFGTGGTQIHSPFVIYSPIEKADEREQEHQLQVAEGTA